MSFVVPARIFNGTPVQIPDAILPVMSVPRVLGTNQPGLPINFNGLEASGMVQITLNQGPSSGRVFGQAAILVEGLWRVTCQLLCTVFVGPAASSAAPESARIAMYSPGGLSACALCMTFNAGAGVTQQASFSGTFNIGTSDAARSFEIWVETMVTTGVGQSVGCVGNVYIERLA